MSRRTPPLSPNLPMVDPDTGTPTPFFMRWWQDQIDSNAVIPSLSTEAEISALLDILVDGGATPAAQGTILFRGASLWEVLGPGTANDYLQTQGPSADPVWAAVATNFLALADTPNDFTGQAGKTLTVNVGETALEFATSGGGAMTLVTTIDMAATSAATYDVTGLAGYDDIRIIGQDADCGGAGIQFRVSDDNGATFYAGAADYHRMFLDSGGDGTNSGNAFELTALSASGAQGFLADVENLSLAVPTTSRSTHHQMGTVNYGFLLGGQTAGVQVVDAIRIMNSAGNLFTAGKIYIVGVTH